MKKDDIINKIANSTGMTKKDVCSIVDDFLMEIRSSVSEGHTVYLRGFGCFNQIKREPKSVRDFQANKNHMKASCYYPKFKPYNDFIDMVRNGNH